MSAPQRQPPPRVDGADVFLRSWFDALVASGWPASRAGAHIRLRVEQVLVAAEDEHSIGRLA